MVPRTETDARIRRLQERLRQEPVDGALLVYPIDVYYFTGSRQNSALWVPADGEPMLLVKKSYARAAGESNIRDVRPFPSSRGLPSLFAGDIRKIGLTFDVLPVQQFRYYSDLLHDREFIDVSAINREIRSVKSPWELGRLRDSGKGICGAFAQVPSFLRPGMRELDVAAEFEYRLRTAGSEGHLRIRAFHQEIVGIAVGGDNATVPGCFDGPVTGKGLSTAAPYGPSEDVIAGGSPVMIDYGAIFGGYIVDMTRIFVVGELDAGLQRAFCVSAEILAWIVERLRPGSICEDLYAGAVRIAEGYGLGEQFMGYPGEQAKFVGHGVGLELDELPVLAQRFRMPLAAGHVIAVEPKFAFPGKGVVGIENTYAVTETECEKITNYPDEIVYL
ncbi:MAG: Xaa-Pro peptidase family protein [Nitrospiraceae bacterium]|nr:Xaa-Pro peptidase family protein [Nitrospiraceae bacterium]